MEVEGVRKEEDMRIKMFLVIVLSVLFLFGCSSGNLQDVKDKAPEVWKQNGFKVVGYEGYQWGKWGIFSSYGGARVWHRLENIPDNGIIYSGYIQRWGKEYHIYGPHAIDAIRPSSR
jgi:hypothetical protein